MLSIQAIGGIDRADYYLDLAREDYYLEGGEPIGRWFGEGAQDLNLPATVDAESLKALLEGFAPPGAISSNPRRAPSTPRRAPGAPLVQNAGEPNRQPGWDLTFSAPKSVSTLWAVSDERLRNEIGQAHEAAVKAALNWIQDSCVYTRRGKEGKERERVGMVCALFDHSTSRLLDPQLHTHCLLVNIGTRTDGTVGAIMTRLVYLSKMAGGALYRAELAAQLEKRLEIALTRERNWFEIQGVPPDLIRTFSKRRQEILSFLDKHGYYGAKASAYATLSTRSAKALIPRQTLLAGWQEIAQRNFFTFERARRLCRSMSARLTPPEKLAHEQALAALEAITWNQSHFARRDVIRYVAEAGIARGVDADLVIEATDKILQSEHVVVLNDVKDERRYTTPEMLALEKHLISMAEATKQDARHVIPESRLAGPTSGRGWLWQKRDPLKPQQHEALKKICSAPGSIQVVDGLAGTGKTSLLAAAREVWESEGYTVLGAALAGKAARELSSGAGIASETLTWRLLQLSPTFAQTWKHHAIQLWRAARGWPTYAPERLELSERSILVLDEASMIGTRQLAEVIEIVSKAGAKLVLVGDKGQLPAIEAGGPFAYLGKMLKAAKLTQIQRQKQLWGRGVVEDVAMGNIEEALMPLMERGLLTIVDDPLLAQKSLVQEWNSNRTRDLKETLVLTSTNHEAAQINQQVQALRREMGEVGWRHVRVGEQTLREGDRILFTRNAKPLSVNNGTLGTISHIEMVSRKIHIKLDDERKVMVPLKYYSDLTLGYAVTTHRAQGATVDKAFVLINPTMLDRESLYVQLSRARHETHVFCDKVTAGKDGIEELIRGGERSRAKDLAIEHLPKPKKSRAPEHAQRGAPEESAPNLTKRDQGAISGEETRSTKQDKAMSPDL